MRSEPLWEHIELHLRRLGRILSQLEPDSRDWSTPIAASLVGRWWTHLTSFTPNSPGEVNGSSNT